MPNIHKSQIPQDTTDYNAILTTAISSTDMRIWYYELEQDQFYLFNKGKYIPTRQNLKIALCNIHPNERQLFSECVTWEHLDTATKYKQTYRFYNYKQQSYRYYSCQFSPVRDQTGTVIRVVAVQEDVTEAILTERDLNQQYKRLEAIYGNLPVGLIECDKDGNIILLNQKQVEIFGFGTRDYFIGKNIFNYSLFNAREKKLILQKDNVEFDIIYGCPSAEGELAEHKYINIRTANVAEDSDIAGGKIIVCDDRTDRRSKQMRIDQQQSMLKARAEELERIHKTLLLSLKIGNVSLWRYDIGEQMYSITMGYNDNIPFAHYKLTKEQLLRRIHPQDKELLMNTYNDVVTGNTPRGHCVVRIYNNKTKGYNYYESSMALQLDKSENHMYLTGIQKEITADVVRSNELETSRKTIEEWNVLFENILTQSPCAMFIKDMDNDGRYIVANALCCDYIGKPRNEVVGYTDWEIFSEYDATRFIKDDLRTLDSDSPNIFTEEVEWNGKHIIWHTTKSSITTSDNRRLLIGISLDISETEKSRNEIKDAKDRAEQANLLLNSVIQQIPLGLFIKDVDNDLRYIIINNSLTKIDNLTEFEAIGRNDFEIYPQEIASMFNRMDTNAISAPIGDTISTQISRNINGHERIFQITDKVIKPSDDRRLLIGVVRDITDDMHTHNELQAAKEKAEQSDKLKSAFLANMSHEIRTPLNAIVGFSQLMLDEDSEINQRQEYFNIISSNTELLLRLIEDILDLSRIESGTIDLIPETFDMSAVFDEVYAIFSQRITNPNVQFLGETPYKSCIVTIDKNRIKQVGINFLTNAIKYTETGTVKMGYEYTRGGIMLFVEDTGIGIAEQYHDKVFSRFEKFESHVQGTGLGLSICKAITQTLGGKIGFESKQGIGSRFWAWFPCEATIEYKTESRSNKVVEEQTINAEPNKSNSNIENTDRKSKILIAEDIESNFLLVKHILRNYDLTHVVNGELAVEKARNESYDLILMDMRMPVMDGMEATRRIREFDTEIPIVAVTGNAFDSDKTEAFKVGFTDFITKPLKPAELMELVRKLTN